MLYLLLGLLENTLKRFHTIRDKPSVMSSLLNFNYNDSRLKFNTERMSQIFQRPNVEKRNTISMNRTRDQGSIQTKINPQFFIADPLKHLQLLKKENDNEDSSCNSIKYIEMENKDIQYIQHKTKFSSVETTIQSTENFILTSNILFEK